MRAGRKPGPRTIHAGELEPVEAIHGWRLLYLPEEKGGPVTYLALLIVALSQIPDTRVPEGSAQATAEAVEGLEGEAASLPDTALVSSIVLDAISFLGTPYVYGGTGPSGFDCSGLIYRVFNDNGVAIPRTVSAIEELGEEVDREDLRPGDLLIFDNPKHIGLFIGDGEFIHSSSYLDRGVVITPLEQPNYSRRFSEARRIL
jgi:cell wall-associated NlpC family hydrolase